MLYLKKYLQQGTMSKFTLEKKMKQLLTLKCSKTDKQVLFFHTGLSGTFHVSPKKGKITDRSFFLNKVAREYMTFDFEIERKLLVERLCIDAHFVFFF